MNNTAGGFGGGVIVKERQQPASLFEVALDLLQFVPREDPVKISRLRLENRSGQSRRLFVTAYAEWTLGSSRSPAIRSRSNCTTSFAR